VVTGLPGVALTASTGTTVSGATTTTTKSSVNATGMTCSAIKAFLLIMLQYSSKLKRTALINGQTLFISKHFEISKSKKRKKNKGSRAMSGDK
jgi:hypothetical protein